MKWPPDYRAEYVRRFKLLQSITSGNMWVAAHRFYKDNPIDWIEDWCVTIDPRNAGTGLLTHMPLRLFDRQKELIVFFEFCRKNKVNGLVEKCRDVGATWVACAYSAWLWRYHSGAQIGWGSRKLDLVDKLGIPDSILEKIRVIIRNLPPQMWPQGFHADGDFMPWKRIINPENGASISGEGGDNIGRGGRSTIYFKDEAAHLSRPELIEASLNNNTDVQIDISSVNGIGNVFHNKRKSGVIWDEFTIAERGKIYVFVFEWWQNPLHDQAWFDHQRDEKARQGLLHIFAQEVERDYAAAQERVVIPKRWIESARDAHIKLGFEVTGSRRAGFDVADEGGDTNAAAFLHGFLVEHLEEWPDLEVDQASYNVIRLCRTWHTEQLQYDALAVGSGAKTAVNAVKEKGELPEGLQVVAWRGSASPTRPEWPIDPDDPRTPKRKDFYSNLKAQGWWTLRRRFELTHRAVTEGGTVDPDSIISIPTNLPHRSKLEDELSQATFSANSSGKLIIDKQPKGTKSPNLADALVMASLELESPRFFA